MERAESAVANEVRSGFGEHKGERPPFVAL